MNRRSLLKRCLLAPIAVWFGFSVEPEVDTIELEGQQFVTMGVYSWTSEVTNTGRYVRYMSGSGKGELIGYTFTDQPPSRSGNAEKVGL